MLTGSSNFKLLHSITQSLAGRTALFTLLPFSMEEVSSNISEDTNQILFKGLYPDIFAKKTPASILYRNYYNTYIERDVHQLINIKNMMAFQTFIRLCAGRVGSECNFSSLANEVGVSAPTINEWICILQSSYILWKLPPYYANINKRLVKSPKLYFYDTGLLCYLLGIEKAEQLQTHPLRGNIFENFVVTEFLKRRFNKGLDSNLFYYRENKGNEVDMLSINCDKMNICEIKSAQTFSATFNKGLKHLEGLFGEKIEKSFVVYDGKIESSSDIHGIYNFRNIPEI